MNSNCLLFHRGQGSIALAAGADGGCLDFFFSRLSFLFSLVQSLGDGPI